jgi:hypothetical protein
MGLGVRFQVDFEKDRRIRQFSATEIGMICTVD